jgi:Protein of unknown function (DUF2752)
MTPIHRAATGASRHAVIAPVAAAIGALGGLITVGLVDPANGGRYLSCPFNALTGHWCPGCGMTRATHHLLTGHPIAALGSNLMFPVFAALLIGGWLAWFRTAHGRPVPAWPSRAPTWSWVAMVAAMVIFTVLRNLPIDPFAALAP